MKVKKKRKPWMCDVHPKVKMKATWHHLPTCSACDEEKTAKHLARPAWMREIAKAAADLAGGYAELGINEEKTAEWFSGEVEKIYLNSLGWNVPD